VIQLSGFHCTIISILTTLQKNNRLHSDWGSEPFLTCVYVSVLLHVRLLVEPLSAVLARVGPGVRVYEEVSGQRRAPLERLAALLARERPLAVVHRSARGNIHSLF
jgi:hypothetical protein